MNPLPDPAVAGGAGWAEVVAEDGGGDPVGGDGLAVAATVAGLGSVAGPPGTSVLRAGEAAAGSDAVSAPVAAAELRRTGRDDAVVTPSVAGAVVWAVDGEVVVTGD